MAKSIRSAIKGIDKAVQVGTARALNRALDNVRTKLAKDLRQDTGLKSERIKRRLLTRKASPEKLRSAINVAIKVGIALREFDPKEKIVRRNKRAYNGITVKIGRAPRQLVPGAFPLVGKTGEAVLIRKLSYTKAGYTRPDAPKYPLAQPRYDIGPAAKGRARFAMKDFQEAFDKRVSHEIQFALKKRFSGGD